MIPLASLSITLCLAVFAPGDSDPPAGFTALFDGKTLNGWKNEGKAKGHWSVKDGVLLYDGKGDSLVTAKPYKDFELYVDWKIDKGGDSGIYLRGCPQVQIWDNPIGSGGLYNNEKGPSKPLVVADKPIGEWNTFHITMKGDVVSVELNGKLVVDKVPLENYFDRTKSVPAVGPIELQHHDHPLEFRNIFVKEL